jgi:hypothetical protein
MEKNQTLNRQTPTSLHRSGTCPVWLLDLGNELLVRDIRLMA